MTFAEWLTGHYQRPGETRTQAIERVQLRTGLAYTTVWRAFHGYAVSGRTATMLHRLSKRHITYESLVGGETWRPGARNATRQAVAR